MHTRRLGNMTDVPIWSPYLHKLRCALPLCHSVINRHRFEHPGHKMEGEEVNRDEGDKIAILRVRNPQAMPHTVTHRHTPSHIVTHCHTSMHCLKLFSPLFPQTLFLVFFIFILFLALNVHSIPFLHDSFFFFSLISLNIITPCTPFFLPVSNPHLCCKSSYEMVVCAARSFGLNNASRKANREIERGGRGRRGKKENDLDKKNSVMKEENSIYNLSRFLFSINLSICITIY